MTSRPCSSQEWLWLGGFPSSNFGLGLESRLMGILGLAGFAWFMGAISFQGESQTITWGSHVQYLGSPVSNHQGTLFFYYLVIIRRHNKETPNQKGQKGTTGEPRDATLHGGVRIVADSAATQVSTLLLHEEGSSWRMGGDSALGSPVPQEEL